MPRPTPHQSGTVARVKAFINMPDERTQADLENDSQFRAEIKFAHDASVAAVPIVGLGASAGGIEAFTQFFGATPSDSGAAYVLVLHLDPTRESQLSSIIARHTAMPVMEIEDGMVVAPNHVYVIAPNHDLTLDGNTLRLTEPEQPRGHRHPIDVLFKSLAEQRTERTVAIILSGTGTNGTQGLKEIKGAGGLILVQDPEAARFDGMPRSAIGAGLADHVLLPSAMPAKVLDYLRHGYFAAPDGLMTRNRQTGIDQLVGLLRIHSGREFRSYKPTTLLRRINRRMSLKGLEELDAYLDLLRVEPNEVQALVRDLLISVTSFFRDSEAWATLDESVITQIVADRETGGPVRVWVPACATGEEAYSVAMLLIERAEATHKQLDVKIFASDLLDDNLNTARAGVYPGASVEMLPPERIRQFFEKLDGSYQIRKKLRDLVVFARQDLLRDPPFSRMDLITCRNMLIYIEPEAQRRAMTLFHFALREGGRLFLGSAETIGRAEELFDTISKKWRIYRRIGPTRHDIVDFPLLGGHPATHRMDTLPPPEPSTRASETARRALLDRYAPASVLIDRKGRALYFHGETGDYLKQPNGEPTRDLLAMARDGLLGKLRGAMQTAIVENQNVSFSARVRQRDKFCSVRVTLSPLTSSPNASDLVLVTFEPDHRGPQPVAHEQEADNERAASPVLENELRSVRAELQGTIEQLESVNEELKAANEEATSMNEELQSTNEELETSKEELQSFNEELHSVNSQLQHKIGELDETSNDLANLLSGSEIATLFLDQELRIKWFSPTTKQLLELASSDIGRPMRHFALKFADDKLLSDADAVLTKLTTIEAEVHSDDGKWFLRRIMPYRTRDNRIAGLVVTFIDITDRRGAAVAVNEARIYAEAIVQTVRHPLVVLDGALRVRSANRAFYTLFDMVPDRTEEQPLYELGDGKWNGPELRTLLEEVLSKNQCATNVEFAFGPTGPGQRTMLLNARKLDRNGGREALILLAVEEVTEQKQTAGHQEMLIGELNHRVKNVLATVQAVMTQTLRQSTSLDVFKAAFAGRLHALAQAHNLLVEKEWVGADIGQIVHEVLAPYRTNETTQIVAEGPKLTVRPQIGVALMMILHELTTNAVKYGALSAPAGMLRVSWHRKGAGIHERIHVQWSETGGPKVKPPSRQGFGTKLIERSTAHELGGEARLEYLQEGVRAELIFSRQEKMGPAKPDGVV